MNEEMLKKLAGGGKSSEEVLAVVKEYGKEMTLEQAQALCDKLKASANGELSDEELDGVAGGLDFFAAIGFKAINCSSCGHYPNDCPYGSPMDGLFAATSSTCPKKTAR